VPLATGNAGKVELRELIEEQLIDYARVRIPNEGGITEYMKIAGMCEAALRGIGPRGHRTDFHRRRGACRRRLPMCHFLLQVGRCGHAALPASMLWTSVKARSMSTSGPVWVSNSIPKRQL